MIALLGIAQRTIVVERTVVIVPNQGRKPFPTIVKTLGDLLKIRRCERGLKQLDLAVLLQIGRRRVTALERDESVPTAGEWKRLSELLGLPAMPTEAIRNSGA